MYSCQCGHRGAEQCLKCHIENVMNGILGGVFLDLEFIEQQCLLYVMHIVCGGKKWVISPH